MFMTGTVTALELADLAEDHEEGLSEASPDLIQDMRVMFVELLRAAYNAQIRDGELDPREYEGFLSYSLLQSLEFAHDDAMKGKPLDDWNKSQVATGRYVDQTEYFLVRLYACLRFRKTRPDARNLGLSRTRSLRGNFNQQVSQRILALRDEEPLLYQRLRLEVLRAFSFIDAHSEAQDRLHDEFGQGGGEMAAAFRTVINESKAEVQKAEAVLRSKTKKQLKSVISHYLCTILQNKAARYIKLLMDSGVLLPRETRHYLEKIEHNIIEIRHCPLDEHPGTIKLKHAEEEELKGKAARPRRKRERQQSIL
jgi:hypothetical protein